MSGKGGHSLLTRLLETVARREPFRDQYQQFKRQLQWLLDLEQILDKAYQCPNRSPSVAAKVAARVDEYLRGLLATVESSGDELDQAVAGHIDTVFRHRWWGLFTCYEFDFLPRTNNDLEQLIRNLKTDYRRTTGRKYVLVTNDKTAPLVFDNRIALPERRRGRPRKGQ